MLKFDIKKNMKRRLYIYLKQSINPKMSQALTFCFAVRHEDYFYGYGACHLRGFKLGFVFCINFMLLYKNPAFLWLEIYNLHRE